MQFDPSNPEHLANPYRTYTYLRHAGRAVWADSVQTWLLGHHADISVILRDPRFGQDQSHARTFLPTGGNFAQLEHLFKQWMLFHDPPSHTRLRGLVNKAFTPRVVDGMRAHMERLVDELLDRVAPSGQMDVIADLAFPLPVAVIALLLGVPGSDHEQFKQWSNALAATLEPIVPVVALAAANQATGELLDYFRELVAEKRRTPGEDLLSAMVHAEEHGQRLTTDELLANAVLIMAAGHETTVNLIGNGVLALLQHPDQLTRLRSEPSLIKSAVEELLRYDSPVQMTTRIAKEEVSMAGATFAAGQEVFLVIGSGNRDPNVFEEPDRLDLARENNPHLSFGAGVHYCVGASLARLEGQIAIGRLVERFKGLRLATETPVWRPLAVLRGLVALPVTW
jgi:hypothetical protein